MRKKQAQTVAHINMLDKEEKLKTIYNCLQMAGYQKIKIRRLGDFDKILGGLLWCIQNSNYFIYIENYSDDMNIGQKIRLSEQVVKILQQMECPINIQPHQIQGMDLPVLIQVFKWLVQYQLTVKNKLQNKANLFSHFYKQQICGEQQYTDQIDKTMHQYLRKYSNSNIYSNNLINLYSTLIEYGDQSVVQEFNRMVAGLKQQQNKQSVIVQSQLLSNNVGQVVSNNVGQVVSNNVGQVVSNNVGQQFKQVGQGDQHVDKELLVQQINQNVQIIQEMETNYQVVKSQDTHKNLVLEKQKLQQELQIQNVQIISTQQQVQQLQIQITEFKDQNKEVEYKIQQQEDKQQEYYQMQQNELNQLKQYQDKIQDWKQKVNEFQMIVNQREKIKKEKQILKKQAKYEMKQMEQQIVQMKIMNGENVGFVEQIKEQIEQIEPNYLEKKRLECGLKQNVNLLKRKVENYPILSEILQYQQRFIELFEQINQESEKIRTQFIEYNHFQDKLKLKQSRYQFLCNFKQSLSQIKSAKKSLKNEFVENNNGIFQQMEQTNIDIIAKEREVMKDNMAVKNTYHQNVEKEREYFWLLKQLQVEIDRLENDNLNND